MTLLVKATIVVGLALVAVHLARRSSAAVRHLILAGAFAVLLLLPLVSAVLPPVPFDLSFGPSQRPLAAPTATVEALVLAPAPAVAGDAVVPADGTPETAPGASLVAILSLGWAFGTLAFLSPVTIGLYRVYRLRRGGVAWPEGRRVVDVLARDAGIGRAIDIRLHDAVPGPVTCGLSRPVILMPDDARSWPDADLRRAVIHELEHVGRGDWAGQCVARTVCALYWFHPLVWIAWRKLTLEAERACDDAVLRRAEADDYASQLVGLARRLAVASHPPLPAMARSRDLPTRVRAVLDRAQARGRAGVARLTVVAAAVLLTVVGIAPLRAAAGQSAALRPAEPADASLPSFEVASIRRNTSAVDQVYFLRQPGGRVNVSNMAVRPMITFAYELQDFQLQGGPGWIESDRFDIVAKAEGDPEPVPPGSGQVDSLRLMMRSLLAERFGLVMHEETQELPIFELVQASGDGTLGPQLRRAATDCAAVAAAARDGAPPPAPSFDDFEAPVACGLRINPGRIRFGGMPLSQFTGALAGMTGRVVVDRTGLSGNWDFEVNFDPTSVQNRLQPEALREAAEVALSLGSPSLVTALEEQLGLKLEPSRGPVEVLVIDSVEQPDEN